MINDAVIFYVVGLCNYCPPWEKFEYSAFNFSPKHFSSKQKD
jgi:hypothetical protein